MSSTPHSHELSQLGEHSAFLSSLARSLVAQSADAEDLEQELWLAALSKRQALDSPRAWFATVARRLRGRERVQAERRAARERAVASDEALPSSEHVVERLEIAQRLTAAVRRLAEPFRSTLHSHYAEGLSAREIARRSELPLETVRSRIKRGLEHLRRDLDLECGGDRSSWCVALAPLVSLTNLKTVQHGGLFVMHWKLIASITALAAVVGLWQAREELPLELEALSPLSQASQREELRGTPPVESPAPAEQLAGLPQVQEPLPAPQVPERGNHRSEARTTGRLVGQVRIEGELPTLEPFEFETLEKTCHCPLDPSMDLGDRRLRFDATGGLRDVVISVEVGAARAVVPSEPIVVHFRKDRIEPHLSIVPKGARIRFDNDDQTYHNVHGYPRKNAAFNYSLQPERAGKSFILGQEESFELRDDLRPWMRGWVFVSDDEFITKTDAHGNFAIEALPPGRYRIRAWHPHLGNLKVRDKPSIERDGTASLTVVVPEKAVAKALRQR